MSNQDCDRVGRFLTNPESDVLLSLISPFTRRITLDEFTSQRSTFQKPAESCSEVQPLVDLKDYVITYAREKPDVALLTCLGLGFILGWKLKPW